MIFLLYVSAFLFVCMIWCAIADRPWWQRFAWRFTERFWP